jgi:hypothetical protein
VGNNGINKQKNMKFTSKYFQIDLDKMRQDTYFINLILLKRTKNYVKATLGGLSMLILFAFVIKGDPKFDIKGTSKDKKYGYKEEQPIMVGGGTSAGYHFMFLRHLRGPKGEQLEVNRIGSCGTYPNPDTTLTKFNEGVLTCFSINCPSFKKPKVLYFDKYRTGDLYIPKGLTWEE